MCGRYVLIANLDELERRWSLSQLPLFPSSYNVAPTQIKPVIVADGSKTVQFMHWGLIPRWMKEYKSSTALINIRSDSLKSKPLFRKLLQYQRCIVPMNGFYEWKKDGKSKIRYFIHMKNGQSFGAAGVYDIWMDRDGNEIPTYAIITTEPNNLVANVHNRMPTILLPNDEELWLNPDEVEVDKLLGVINPYPDSEMEMYPVSPSGNKVSFDSPVLLEEIEEPPTQQSLF